MVDNRNFCSCHHSYGGVFGYHKSKIDRKPPIEFIDERKEDWNYWNKTEEEYAWSAVKTVLESNFPKVGQNGLYDIQYLWRQYGLRVNNYLHDTMLLHHSLQPELPKGLGFLGSVYCSERAWKKLRTFEEEKPDE